jgi:GNAT superfamily N-acetyltransferase
MSLQLRPATPADIPFITACIRELAAFERLSHQVTGRAADLERHLFGEPRYCRATIAEWDGTAAAYALTFFNYSTFRMQPGLYLEDLYVRPEFRRRGIATALLRHLARQARDLGCARFEWSVLDWNANAIATYENLGATVLPDWRICRLEGEALHRLGGA